MCNTDLCILGCVPKRAPSQLILRYQARPALGAALGRVIFGRFLNVRPKCSAPRELIQTNLILLCYPGRSVNRRIIHHLINIYIAENGVCICVICSLYLESMLLLPLSSSVSNNEAHVKTQACTFCLLSLRISKQLM